LLKGIRGAINIENDDPETVEKATRELLEALFQENNLQKEKITAVFFTQTADIVSAYPAKAARDFGLSDIPLMSAQEPKVMGSMPRVIRVLILTEMKEPDPVKHVYLKDAVKLRQDLA